MEPLNVNLMLFSIFPVLDQDGEGKIKRRFWYVFASQNVELW